MQPRIITKTQLILAGMSFFGDPFESRPGWDEENEIGRLWARFTACMPALPADLFISQDTAYEVHLATSETAQKGTFEIFVGMQANPSRLADCPLELCIKVLPSIRYAAFTFQGEAIVSDWEKEMQAWLNENGYTSPYAYNCQVYDSRFKGMDRLSESAIDVYVPIENKS